MVLFVRAGQRHLALRQYRQLCDVLRRELDAEPDQRMQALHAQILRGNTTPEPRVPPPFAEVSIAHLTLTTVEPVLVGRNAEVEEFKERVDRLFTGRGGLVLVKGETGVGKSRLVAEVSSLAASLGATVLWARACLDEAHHSFGPFCAALEGFARSTARAGLLTSLSERASMLARLLHASASPSDRGQLTQGGEVPMRRTVFPAIADYFTNLAGNAPVLVMFDDFHLADDASLMLVQYLSPLARDVPLLLLCTMSSEEARLAVSSSHVMPQLVQEGFAVQMVLQRLSFPLSCELVTALLGRPAEQAVLERIYALADGNPHLTQEAVQALRGRDQLREMDGVWRLHSNTVELPNSTYLRRRTSVSK
jgi:predicted ATPase